MLDSSAETEKHPGIEDAFPDGDQINTALTMKPLKGLLLILPLALITSCMVGPNYQTPDAKLEGQWTYNSPLPGRRSA